MSETGTRRRGRGVPQTLARFGHDIQARAARALVLLLALTAGACDSTRELTPWFRIRTHHPLLDQPVLIGGERRDVASARVGGSWVKVAEGRVFSAASSDRRAVLYLSGEGWRIITEAGAIADLGADCTFPAFHPTEPVVYCARCAVGRCGGTVVAVLDLSGRPTRELSGVEPTVPEAFGVSVVGVLPTGAVVIQSVGACRLFSVGPEGSTLLATKAREARCDSFQDWQAVLEPLRAAPVIRSTTAGW